MTGTAPMYTQPSSSPVFFVFFFHGAVIGFLKGVGNLSLIEPQRGDLATQKVPTLQLIFELWVGLP